MKTYIFILINLLVSFPAATQEFHYFKLVETPDIIANLEVKDMPLTKLNLLNWRSSYFRDADWDKIKELERDKYQNIFKNCSTEEVEALKKNKNTFFLDNQLNVLSINLAISSNYLSQFSTIEEKVYNYIQLHPDLSYLKPYLLIPEDFTGASFRISLNWLFE